VSERAPPEGTRRTRLANERTYLAWYRTGLTALAVCVGLGRLVPELTDVESLPYEIVGAGYGILGIACIAAGFARARNVQRAIDAGGYAPLSTALSVTLGATGVLLALATIALVFV
jgi:putative membrane protein